MSKLVCKFVLGNGTAKALKEYLEHSDAVKKAKHEGLSKVEVLLDADNPGQVEIYSTWSSLDSAKKFREQHPDNPLFGRNIASNALGGAPKEKVRLLTSNLT